MFLLIVVVRLQRVYVMAGDGISGATDSVIIGTSGSPVVPDTSFSQPISAAEIIPAGVPIMSELSRVLNTFLILVTQESPLPPTLDWDGPTHSNE